MHLLIYIDDITNEIIQMVPIDEINYKLGDVVEIKESKYSIVKLDSEEFLDYELIVDKIRLTEFVEDKV